MKKLGILLLLVVCGGLGYGLKSYQSEVPIPKTDQMVIKRIEILEQRVETLRENQQRAESELELFSVFTRENGTSYENASISPVQSHQ